VVWPPRARRQYPHTKMQAGPHMRSSAGEYFMGLDHVRAVAVFLVFCWHFLHAGDIVPIDGSMTALPVMALFTQGFTGVSLFMVLSGYLFAKLSDGHDLRLRGFWFNRALRLLPLLSVVLVLAFLKSLYTGESLYMAERLAWGWLLPTLPQGAWSVTVEAHFYLLFPGVLWLTRRTPTALLGVVALALGLRGLLYWQEVKLGYVAYATLVGRIDQFLLGCLAWHWRHLMTGRHLIWAVSAAAFVALMCHLDRTGSLLIPRDNFSPWWIGLTTLEGLFHAITVAWYDTSFKPGRGWLSRGVARVGQYSYAIYLLHTFVVFKLAVWIHTHVLVLSNVYLAVAAAALSFLLFLPVAALSFRLIEAPILRLRVPYLTSRETHFDSPAPFAVERLAPRREARGQSR